MKRKFEDMDGDGSSISFGFRAADGSVVLNIQDEEGADIFVRLSHRDALALAYLLRGGNP